MSTVQRVCGRHLELYPAGERCPSCRSEDRDRGRVRRQRNHRELGRMTRHWRELSFRMIRRHRTTLGPICPECQTLERTEDPGSKLTLDLVRGGDHRTATEADVRVLCRRCHGRAQGARR